jgi:predicted MPP superfamily phosphohydrolase
MIFFKRFKNFIYYVLYLCISTIILLELIFRILPTSTPLPLKSVTDKNDILRYNAHQKSTFSLGKDFYQIVTKTTNNYGFFSSYDYIKNSKPDLVVIGDSMIEAAQIKNEDTFGEIITKLKPSLNVYQMGVSGIALPQYLKMLQFADNEFYAKHYIISIVSNDFNESICDYKMKEGTWCFNKNFELEFKPFDGYSLKRKIARNSAFARYLVFNIGISWREVLQKINLNDPGLNDTIGIKNEITDKADQILLSYKAIDKFLEKIKDLNLDQKVTLLIDIDREKIYKDYVNNDYNTKMRDKLIKSAKKKDIHYIDLRPIFENDYRKNNKKFDFKTDGHWNEYSHSIIANTFLSLQKK